MKIFRNILASSLLIFSAINAQTEDVIKNLDTPENSVKNEEKNEEQVSNEIKIVITEEDNNDDNSELRQFEKKISEIITTVKKYCPQFVEKKKEFYSNGIKGFLEQTSPELDYLENGIDAPPKDEKKSPEFHKPLIIDAQKILYIRIDGFSEENFIKLKEECVDVARLSNPPIGVILDLRSSSGENGIISAKYASIFCNNDSVSFVNNKEKEILGLTMMILISAKTAGDPEIFTTLLMKSGRALLIGEKSAGMPFAKFPIKLNNGGTLILPDIPPDLAWIRISPLIPSVDVKAYPQIDYDLISKKVGSEESDECIRRVSDLLVSLDAIHKNKDKKK